MKKERFYIYNRANMKPISWIKFINKYIIITYCTPNDIKDSMRFKTEKEANKMILKIAPANPDLSPYLKIGDTEGSGIMGFSHLNAIKTALFNAKNSTKESDVIKAQKEIYNYGKFWDENYEFYLEISSLIRLLSDKDSNFNIKEVREIAIELNKRMIEIEKDETT